jgi:hypothetical protein
MLIALGILLGVASSSFQQSKADPPAGDDNGRGTAAVVAELKEIKSQLTDMKSQVKDINAFLHNGVIRNFAVMNPPADRAAPDQ